MKRTVQRGFTLIELLAVVTIISILVGLISLAASSAISAAKRARIAADVGNLTMAMESFKVKYGAYPPANLGDGNINQVSAFVARVWPRYNQGAGAATLKADLTSKYADRNTYNPAKSLVFWLSGFSPDPGSPFSNNGTIESLYDFDTNRIVNGQYLSNKSDPNTAFLYIDSPMYGTAANGFSAYAGQKTNSFQVVSPGLDGVIGGGGALSVGDDNITNFSGGKTISDMLDQ